MQTVKNLVTGQVFFPFSSLHVSTIFPQSSLEESHDVVVIHLSADLQRFSLVHPEVAG